MTLLTGNQIDIFGNTEPVPVKHERVKNDYYPTPEPITKALLDTVPIHGTVFEPCAGQSAISNVLWCSMDIDNVIESDLTWSKAGDIPRDATTERFWRYWTKGRQKRPAWMITNPPFNVATEILKNSWEHCTIGCAFLLRLSYIEPCGDRAEILKEMSDNLRLIMPVSPRPKFRADTSGSDSVTCAWFVWDKRFSWQRIGVESPFQFLTGWKS